jgi:hypothetical protein
MTELTLGIWEELAERIAKDMLDPNKVFPEHRTNLKEDIKKIINQWTDERIVVCYFLCRKDEVQKAKGGEHKNGKSTTHQNI